MSIKPDPNYLDFLQDDCNQFKSEGFKIFGCHQSSIILSVTEDAVSDFGYSMEEFQGMNAWRLFDSSSFTEVSSHLYKGVDAQYDANALHKDGHIIPIHLNIVQRDLLGESVRLVAYKLR